MATAREGNAAQDAVSRSQQSNHKKAPSDEGAIDTNLNWRSAESWEGGSSTEVTRIGTCDRKGVGDCGCLSGTGSP